MLVHRANSRLPPKFQNGQILQTHLEFWRAIAEGRPYEEAKEIFPPVIPARIAFERAFPRTHSYLRSSTVEDRQAYGLRMVRLTEEEIHDGVME